MAIIALVSFIGIVVFGILFIILGIKGSSLKLPGIGISVCFALLIVSVMLLTLENNDRTADGNLGTTGRATQGADEGGSSEGKESAENTVSVTESHSPENQSNEPYEITYQSSKLYKSTSGEIRCYALVEIENTGADNLYLKDATFDFEDSQGGLWATCSGITSADPDIIAPGEKGYFYCNMGSVSGNIDENADYKFKPSLKVEKAKNNIIRFDVTNLSISAGKYNTVDIIGRVTNNTNDDESLLWVACILYRADGTPIGACGTTLTGLDAGQTISFDISGSYLSDLDFQLEDVAEYRVYACKTQYQF